MAFRGSVGGFARPGQASRPVIKPTVSSGISHRPGAVKPTTTIVKKPLETPLRKTISSSSNGAGAAGKTPAFKVTTNSKNDSLGLPTLVGDYAEVGSNHQRKYYQKIQAIPGHANVKVFLYYWDMRDGSEFAGWWFGDKVGGSEVWARCNSHGQTPPVAGWRVPWNAPKAEPGLLTVSPHKGGASSHDSSASSGRIATSSAPAKVVMSAPANPALEAKVRKATAQIAAVERSVQAVVSRSKALTKEAEEQALAKVHSS
jgi:hypothetical protein